MMIEYESGRPAGRSSTDLQNERPYSGTGLPYIGSLYPISAPQWLSDVGRTVGAARIAARETRHQHPAQG